MTREPDSTTRAGDLPTVELDALVDRLVDRADDSEQTQDRLRSLIRAIESVSSDLSLEQLLRRLTEAARMLSGARYAALGVIAEDRTLEQFIHVGMDDEAVAQIGALPEGKGLIGALINDPGPIRLGHVSDDPRSVGFPEHHPPMGSFLGMPIHVRGEVYGNLYLTDSSRGEFSEADEELVRMLAGAAGSAISNARNHQEVQLQQRWLQASNDVHSQLFRSGGEDPLHIIARRTIEIADGDLVSVALLSADRASVVIEYAIGHGAEEMLARRFDLAGTLSEQVINSGEPVMTSDGASLATLPVTHRIGVLDTGPIIVLPLGGPEQARGVLSIARRRGRHAFTAVEMSMAAGFASHASVALEFADARDTEQKMIMLEDRQRIARDLHDHVIQELFGVGLSLESIAGQLGSSNHLAGRIRERVDDLDRAIRRIRTSIFALHSDTHAPRTGLRQALLDLIDSSSPRWGFRPSLTISGLVDISLGDAVSDDAANSVRRLLDSVAEGGATTAAVEVDLADSVLTVTVTDSRHTDDPQTDDTDADGRRADSLSQLRAMSVRRGGDLTLTPAPGGGTVAIWTVEVR